MRSLSVPRFPREDGVHFRRRYLQWLSLLTTLLGAVLADLALLAQQHESEELTAVVQQLKQAADLHWGDRPERARWAWQAAMGQLQVLLEENPELRGQLVARAEPVGEPSSRRSSRSIRK